MGFLILFMPNTEVIHSRRLVDQISSALTDYVRHLQNSLIIGISQPHSDLSELHDAFEETSAALNRQKLNGDSENIFYYKEAAEPRSFIWEQEEEFLFRVEAGMAAEVQDLTEQLFDLMARTSDFSLADDKYYCYYTFPEHVAVIYLNYYLKQETPKYLQQYPECGQLHLFFGGTEGLLLPVFYEYHGTSEG